MNDIEELKKAFDDIIYMAMRYANKRHTFAPTIVREACKTRAKFGDFHLKQDTVIIDSIEKAGLPDDDLIDLLGTYK